MRAFFILFCCLPALTFAVSEEEYQNVYDLITSDQYTYGKVLGTNNIELNYLKFGTELGSRGSIVILPGRTEASLKYIELAYDLEQAGFSPIYVLSHRGQGLSQRVLKNERKGYVRKFSYYSQDLKIFADQVVYPETRGQNLYLIAHSMGGAAAAQYLQSFPSHFKKVVLSAPMLQIDLGNSSERSVLLQTDLVCRVPFAPYCTDYIPGGNDGEIRDIFEENDVTSSRVRFDFKEYMLELWPQLKLGSPTFRWLRESLIATRMIRHKNAIAKIQIPILLFQAENDTVVVNAGQNQFCQRTRWCHLEVVPQAKHEIFMERDLIRDEVLRKTLNFLE